MTKQILYSSKRNPQSLMSKTEIWICGMSLRNYSARLKSENSQKYVTYK